MLLFVVVERPSDANRVQKSRTDTTDCILHAYSHSFKIFHSKGVDTGGFGGLSPPRFWDLHYNISNAIYTPENHLLDKLSNIW